MSSAQPLPGLPRAVPASTALLVLTQGHRLIVATLFLATGAVGCGYFVGETAARTWPFPTEDVPGQVVRAQYRQQVTTRGTNATWHYDARYEWRGEVREANGSTGRAVGYGDPVTVRVPTAWPSRAYPFVGESPDRQWVWLFPFVPFVIGALMYGFQLRDNVRQLQVLRRGTVTTGFVTGWKRVSSGRNTPPLSELSLEYGAGGGRRGKATLLVHDEVRARVQVKLEPMLFDPAHLDRVVVFEALRSPVKLVDGASALSASSWRPGLKRLVLFGIALVGLGAGLVFGRFV